jgi:hypothetical protein
MKTQKNIYKTDSKGEEFLIKNPDCYDEDGNYVKQRNQMKHLKPKKKKKKKVILWRIEYALLLVLILIYG